MGEDFHETVSEGCLLPWVGVDRSDGGSKERKTTFSDVHHVAGCVT